MEQPQLFLSSLLRTDPFTVEHVIQSTCLTVQKIGIALPILALDKLGHVEKRVGKEENRQNLPVCLANDSGNRAQMTLEFGALSHGLLVKKKE